MKRLANNLLTTVKKQEAQLLLTNRAMPVCKFVEVVQKFL